MNFNAIALMGATGTGKSSLALRLAQQFGTSIICCDSMQVYRGLDIGTAKVTPEEQRLVPHFLLDCIDLPQVCSAQWWADAARAVIASENKQGRVPLIVGGTGLYLRALLDGFADIPDAQPGVREHFETMLAASGIEALHQQLQQVDLELAVRLHSTDTQRIMRGLCVFESTGVPLSEWQQRQPDPQQAVDCAMFVLEKPREQLRHDIAVRFAAMMQAGFLDEVRWMMAQQLPDTHPVMRAVGYRQLMAHVRGECTLEAAVERGIISTRKYAKRQGTWFRNQAKQAEHGEAGILEIKMHNKLSSYD
ncbi:MAG: tRNA (adenosine(37)-N6)-dimethylallyltransferase MiaA [Zetaproteobacteria bacterium CG_4_9_14_3_um_filter_49_83]|nr:MAG: tRNA (adenosine(37)-N6)-dimethylallyltransferase MiaA [Zetaproteobacteria bacterium CG1_02_49_23]PIQ33547.1 MAG: tRNA (adenosine(37)-N6)-dimethylallyltransferase MiaA [Zetaproteobacteria bacterium CG17_big_fil_post_rev_8_21_14_2_50_50_13]PIV29590.1 MAG: tRNA (adenosine(37)-N6)-dimethylallyltransferase MiaA [Zetaproteobacteria bacterium CG02_land_8_20_14_3_00_50_9]PIY56375.1 MAG: tRNA (adenosine(37)-N6)-dimethylallyltransferase MiaA [Zetaproteobacteria bacterium CG_4_10_14_0_8_um_filter_4